MLALTAAGAFGCSENVLVSSWELGLKTDEGDAGASIELQVPTESADAGALDFQAISNAQHARAHARKNDEKSDGHNDGHSSGDKSSH